MMEVFQHSRMWLEWKQNAAFQFDRLKFLIDVFTVNGYDRNGYSAESTSTNQQHAFFKRTFSMQDDLHLPQRSLMNERGEVQSSSMSLKIYRLFFCFFYLILIPLYT